MAECEDILFREERTSDNKVLNELAEKQTAYLQELPVLGFNFKRNSNHMCLKTKFLKLLDITNYFAPGFSYDQFLKAYECKQTKGFFPMSGLIA